MYFAANAKNAATIDCSTTVLNVTPNQTGLVSTRRTIWYEAEIEKKYGEKRRLYYEAQMKQLQHRKRDIEPTQKLSLVIMGWILKKL